MSSFVEKIGEKLHIGGHKKKEENPGHPQHAEEIGHKKEEEHASAAGYGAVQHGVVEGGHPQHHAPAGGAHYGHATGAPAEAAAHEGDVAAPPHEGLLEKVNKKIKGKKQDDGGQHESSSSSSESDGEGGRRKKKHGPF